MLSIISHRENTNQNCNDLSPHTFLNSYHQEDKRQLVLVRMWWKGALTHCSWECKGVQSLWKTIWSFLRKLQMDLPYYLAILLLLGVCPQEMKAGLQWRYVLFHVCHSVMHNSQHVQTTQMLFNYWMDKKGIVHTHNKILFSCEKERYLPIATTWMDLEHIVVRWVRQRKTSTIQYHLYVKSKKRRPVKNRVKWWLPKDSGQGMRVTVFKGINLY